MADEGIFLGYSSSTKAYKVLNKMTLIVEKSVYFVLTSHFSKRFIKVLLILVF